MNRSRSKRSSLQIGIEPGGSALLMMSRCPAAAMIYFGPGGTFVKVAGEKSVSREGEISYSDRFICRSKQTSKISLEAWDVVKWDGARASGKFAGFGPAMDAR